MTQPETMTAGTLAAYLQSLPPDHLVVAEYTYGEGLHDNGAGGIVTLDASGGTFGGRPAVRLVVAQEGTTA